MAKKKSNTKKAKEVAPKKKKETKKDRKEKVDNSDDAKGRIVVSQRERDEIDAVIDAFWVFIAAVKRAPKILLLAGIFLTITGATFAGWPQEAFDVEFHGKSGVWVLATKSDFDMARNADGDYVNFDVDDRVWLEGELNEIKYYGPIEERDFPVLGTDANENPSVAPGDSYQKLEEIEFDVLFSSFGDSNNSAINYVNGENIQGKATTRKEFSDTSLDSALFNDVTFTDVIFSNLTLSDTFFVDCTFERVLFDNVLFNRAVFTNSSFNTIFFNSSHIEGSRFESSKFTHLWTKNSVFNNTVFDKTDIFGSKWSYTSLENGTFQRGEINVVIFRSLDVNNFVLNNAEGGRTIKNILDVPNTATFDFTYMTIGETEVKVSGDIEDDYPIGQNLLVSVVVGIDGVAAGTEGENGQWVGDVSGEGFTIEGVSVKNDLNYEFLGASEPDGATGFIVELFGMDENGIGTTLEYTILFNLLTFVGLVMVVYAIGTISTIFSLLKFFSPFLMTVGYFILLSLIMTKKGFLNLSSLMILYFVPPLGKESVIPMGIGMGIHWSILAFSIAFVDIVVCLFLIWNFDLAKKLPFIGSGIKRVQLKGAQILESMPWVERLTFVGIVIFVMIPFQGSGAFAGTILGRAVGLSVISNLLAVGLGALIGSTLIALSVVYGLGFLGYLAPLQLAALVVLIMIMGTLYFVYRHWDELSMEEFTQTLGLHREGVIGAPLTAAGGLVGSAGGSVIRAAEGTGKSVIKAAGDTGRIITKTTSNIVGSFVDSFTDDRYDYMPGTTKELDSGVLVSVPDGARNDVVVTGGAGFIGSHLVDRLVKRDEHVVVLDNFSSGDLEFLYESIENITVIDVDLLNDDFDKYLNGCKIVYHLAANPEVQIGITEPEVMQEQNVDVTEKVLQAMERTGCSRIVFTSTSTVYGDAKKIPTPEDSELKPISAYGQSKLDAEKLIEKYCEEHKFMGVSYRFANCVGPRSNHGVSFDFVNKLRDNPKELEILGDGKQNKSYFHVEDCISAMLAKAPRELCKPGEFVALNVGSKDSIDVVTLANEVCKVMKLKDVEYKFTGGVDGGRGWKGDVKKMRLDIKKMKSHGWDPQFTSRKAIADTAKWLDENS